MLDDPRPCQTFLCPFRGCRTVEWCFRESCPHAHVRRREEDRAARDRRDRLEGRTGTQPSTPVAPEGAKP